MGGECGSDTGGNRNNRRTVPGAMGVMWGIMLGQIGIALGAMGIRLGTIGMRLGAIEILERMGIALGAMRIRLGATGVSTESTGDNIGGNTRNTGDNIVGRLRVSPAQVTWKPTSHPCPAACLLPVSGKRRQEPANALCTDFSLSMGVAKQKGKNRTVLVLERIMFSIPKAVSKSRHKGKTS